MSDPWKFVGGIVLVLLAVVLGNSIYQRSHHDDAPRPMLPAAPKLQLVYVSQRGCMPCAKMERDVFSNARVNERIMREYAFIPTSGADAMARYGIKSVPAYILLSVDGTRELRRGSGYRSADEFIAWLDGRDVREDTGESVKGDAP